MKSKVGKINSKKIFHFKKILPLNHFFSLFLLVFSETIKLLNIYQF